MFRAAADPPSFIYFSNRITYGPVLGWGGV
jgi:hypothetical protein